MPPGPTSNDLDERGAVGDSPRPLPNGTSELAMPVDGLSVLDGPSRQAYDDVVGDFASELLDEASRLEAEHRVTDTPQYTATMVYQAYKRVRHERVLKEVTHPASFVLRYLAATLLVVCGLCGGVAMAEEPVWIGRAAWVVATVSAFLISALLEAFSFVIPGRRK